MTIRQSEKIKSLSAELLENRQALDLMSEEIEEMREKLAAAVECYRSASVVHARGVVALNKLLAHKA